MTEAAAASLGYLKPIVILAINTGMRKGELLNLSWSYIDFAKGVIRVTKTKTGRDREVAINSLVRAELLKLREEPLSEYVFTNPLTAETYHDLKRSFVTV